MCIAIICLWPKWADVPFANVYRLMWPAFLCPVVLVVVVRVSDVAVLGGKAVGLPADVSSPRGDAFPPHVLVAQQVRVILPGLSSASISGAVDHGTGARDRGNCTVTLSR